MIAMHLEQLEEVARASSPYSVSIWMATHPSGPDSRQDSIRLKNLLTEAEERMIASGARAADARQRVEHFRRMISGSRFWRRRDRGLGVLLGDGLPYVFNVPTAVPELVMVGRHFHIKPLLGMFQNDQPFHVLKLSQKSVQLLRGRRYEMVPVELPADCPKSLAEFLRFDVLEPHLDFHSRSQFQQPGQRRNAMFYGVGSSGDRALEKAQLTEFCRKIDNAVGRATREQVLPLVLAGAEPLPSIFLQVCSPARREGYVIEGNPDEATEEDLHRQALALLAEEFERPLRHAARRYGQAEHLGMTANDLKQILPAAAAHAVETLFVSLDDLVWGTLDPDTGEVRRHDRPQGGDEDLLNLAASLAYRSGAAVFAVQRPKVPDHRPVSAILRFKTNVEM